MKIGEDALTLIIEAAHLASCLSANIRMMMSDEIVKNKAEVINEKLIGALVNMTYGVPWPKVGPLSPDDAIDETDLGRYFREKINLGYFEQPMHRDLAKHILADMDPDAIHQPAPNLITSESFEEMWRKIGGYLYKEATEKDTHEKH